MSLPDDITQYHFDLPNELIAQEPSPKRQDSRLLVVRKNPPTGLPRFEDLKVSDLPQLLASQDDLKNSPIVRNRSRVFPARFYVQRSTGGRHEVVALESTGTNTWKAIFRNSSKFTYPQKLFFEKAPELFITAIDPEHFDCSNLEMGLIKTLETHGEMPLPPYIQNRNVDRDKERYQTVWSDPNHTGSAAAPTASLHFTEELCDQLKNSGHEFADLILHVGLGTFEPMRQPSLAQHQLHFESYSVPEKTLGLIQTCKKLDQPMLCIGTTTLRTLESLNLSDMNDPSKSFNGRTNLFIRPGYEFKFNTRLMSNFHLPQSTLFVLMSVYCNSLTLVQEAYQHAISKKYRFFSYGDASIWI